MRRTAPRWPGRTLWAGVILAGAVFSTPGCSRHSARTGPDDLDGVPASTEPVANADSLRQQILPEDMPSALSGSGLTRFYLGDERLPGMTLRFTTQDGAETTAMLRPGMLTPVVSMWTSADAWTLRFPRERAYVLEAGSTGGAADRSAGAAAGGPVGGADQESYGLLLGRLAWYLIAPQALLADLQPVRAFRRGADWIFTGRPGALQEGLPGAEVWVDRESRGIRRWSLRDRDGQLQVQVEYSPPRFMLTTKGGVGGRLDISIPALDFFGGVILQRVNEKDPKTIPAPETPTGWRQLGSDQLQALLEDLVRDLPAEGESE